VCNEILYFDLYFLQMVTATGSSDCTALCTTALQCATNLLPFASFLHAGRQLQTIMLSLIAELPHTSETASTLAELFPDAQSLEAETRNKLDRILKEWQGVLLMDNPQTGENQDNNVTGNSTPRGLWTLAVIYYEKIRDHEQQLRKKQQAFGAYREKLFASGDAEMEDLLIGSRPFESRNDFLVCLDTFYSVSFGSCIESEGSTLPVIDAFVSEVCRTQLELLPAKVTKKSKFTRSVSLRCSRVKSSVAKKLEVVRNTVRPVRKPSASRHGLFCSCSVSETDLNTSRKSPAIFRRTLSQPAEIDILTSKSGLNIRNSTGLHNGIENTNNNNSNGLHASPDPFIKVGQSSSLDSTESLSNGDHIKHALLGYLSKSVLPPATLERLRFDGEIAETERLVEWLNGWAERHCAGYNPVRSSAIRVRVSPQLLAYSLWLIDNCCQHFMPRVNDVTVAVVHSQVPASEPRERSCSSMSVANGSVGIEATLLQQGHQSSGTELSSTGQEVPTDHVKKGRRKQMPVSSDELGDENANGVAQQTWSQEIEDASPPQQSTEPDNRSADNNADRFVFFDMSTFQYLLLLCLLSAFQT